MPPLFSVVVPVYNSEQYLIECVESVLKQGFKSIEIILVDDFSTDKSSAICTTFITQNENIRVIRHEKNFGVSISRNSGINAACGKYIIYLDSDDCLLPGCLSGIAKLIKEKKDPDVIIGRYIRENKNGFTQDSVFDSTVINNSDTDKAIAYINTLKHFLCTCWRFVINRNFIVKNNLYFVNARIYEDQDYVARSLCLSRKLAYYDEHFYWSRARAESLTLTIDYSLSISCLEVASKMCKFIKNNCLSDSKKEFLHARIKYVLNAFYMHLCTRSDKEIYELSKIIEKNIDNFKFFENTSYEDDMYFLNKTGGIYNSLLSYKTSATKEILSIIKNTKYKELYISCVGLSGRITAQMLQNEGICVKGFFDNNKASEGHVVLGLNVYAPSILSHKSKDELSDIFLIVCNERKNAFDAISAQMREIGLKREQIMRKYFLNCIQ